jgi:uncharacterized protein YegP (UPF0339 family)
MMKAIVKESPKDGQFYASFQSANGETWFTSEGYTTRAGAQRSVLDFHAAMKTGAIEIINLNEDGDRIG